MLKANQARKQTIEASLKDTLDIVDQVSKSGYLSTKIRKKSHKGEVQMLKYLGYKAEIVVDKYNVSHLNVDWS